MDPIDQLSSIENAPQEPDKPDVKGIGNGAVKNRKKSNASQKSQMSQRTASVEIDHQENKTVNITASAAVNKAETDIVVKDGTTMSDLKIEKERLETTVMLLQQKLSDKEDGDIISMKFLERKR